MQQKLNRRFAHEFGRQLGLVGIGLLLFMPPAEAETAEILGRAAYRLDCSHRQNAGRAVGEREMPIAIQTGFTIHLRFFLEEQYFDMTQKRDAVLFEWVGNDTAEKPRRHFISFEVLSLASVPDNRYLGFWVDNCFLNMSLKKLQPNRWHNAVLRVQKKQGQFFLDGEIRSPKDLVRDVVGQQNYINTDVVKENYCRLGSNRRGDLTFDGKIGGVAVWNTCLTDQEIAALSETTALKTAWKEPADWECNWAGFYNENIGLHDAYRQMHSDFTKFYQRALKEDIYFPRFHLTVPGFMTEASMSSYKTDAYHIFPHSHIAWCDLIYREAHYWHHLMSGDLLQWKLMPLPEWPKPNACNIVESKGEGICFPQGHAAGVEKWVSTDAHLEHWQPQKKVSLPLPASGVIPCDIFIFKHNGRWYLIGSYAGLSTPFPQTRGLIELYRARDEALEQWDYVGEFYRGSGGYGIHHPQLYFVGDKVVMSSDLPIDKDAEYVLGHIENEKFVREGGGTYQFGYGGWRWGQTITEPSGRVLRWCLFTHLYTENLLVGDMVRRGWEHAYSLPRVVTCKNNHLTFEPAPELVGLRKANLYSTRGLEVGRDGQIVPPLTGNTAQIEARCQIKPTDDGNAGILLKATDDDLVRFYFDRRKSELVLDFSQAKHGGTHPGLGAIIKAPLHLEPNQTVELRLYFDHSVVEAYAHGVCSSGRWFPNTPDKIVAGVFSAEGKTSFSEVDI